MQGQPRPDGGLVANSANRQALGTLLAARRAIRSAAEGNNDWLCTWQPAVGSHGVQRTLLLVREDVYILLVVTGGHKPALGAQQQGVDGTPQCCHHTRTPGHLRSCGKCSINL